MKRFCVLHECPLSDSKVVAKGSLKFVSSADCASGEEYISKSSCGHLVFSSPSTAGCVIAEVL